MFVAGPFGVNKPRVELALRLSYGAAVESYPAFYRPLQIFATDYAESPSPLS
jgi:hypothetical protein